AAVAPAWTRRRTRLGPAPARQPAAGRADGGGAGSLHECAGAARRADRRGSGKPELFRAAHHQQQRVGHHPGSEPGHRRRGPLRLPRPPRRRACAYRLLPAVPQLGRRRLQHRSSLQRAACGPGGLRGARDPAGRGRGARILGSAPDARLVSRARGSLLGLVVGNQLGVPTERLGSAAAIREAFPQGVRDLQPPPKGSPFDDDAAMTLLLAESLVERGDLDAADVAARWVKWMKVDGRGVGLTTQRALRLIERGVEPFEAVRRVPWEQESALPVAVPNEFGYAVHCVEIAFWCAVHQPSLEEALVFLVAAGGDTDTNAAVAGALLGARDGETAIPPRWLDQLGRSNTRGVSELAERLVMRET